MALQNQDFEQTSKHRASNRGNSVSNFLSGVAVLLSTLALLFSGFTAYQVFNLQQKLLTASNPANPAAGNNTAPANPTNSTTATAPVAPSVPDATTQAAPSSGIQPGQFVQPAIGNKAQVELLAVKRIKDPEAGTRDVVNVQMRIRRLAAEVQPGGDSIDTSQTKARNPDTSETYQGVKYDRSSGVIILYSVRRSSSADAYVWLRIPEGVSNIDIFVPDTAAFKNVPITN